MHTNDIQEKRQLEVTLNCVMKGYISRATNDLPVLSDEKITEIMRSREEILRRSYDSYELEEAI